MKINRKARQLLTSIEMLVMDVDGCLTRGEVIYTDAGAEAKVFDAKDGLGLRVAGAAGLKLALLTGRISSVVQRRAQDLHIGDVLQRVGDKEAALRTLAEGKDVALERIAYLGDDLNDRPAMRIAGLSIAPANAVREIRAEADIVLDARGGEGAARQAVELIFRAQRKWESAVEAYLQELAGRERGRGREERR